MRLLGRTAGHERGGVRNAGEPAMGKVTRYVCGVALLVWGAFVLAGCGATGGGGSDTDGALGGWEAQPPIHVGRSRAANPVGYEPAQIKHAYGFDTAGLGTGAGQTIAIVDAYGSPTIQKDLDTFCDKFGLPRTTVQIAYVPKKTNAKNSGWALETSLDVEWAHAMAPAAKILLVVAPSASLSDLLKAVDYAGDNTKHPTYPVAQVSMSWGGGEFSSEESYDFHFNKSGVTFIASSGDSGGGAAWPAVSPNVVGVGGTTVLLDESNNITSETAWGGSNGGPSAYEPVPPYQNGALTSGSRGVPDVSYLADPNYGVAVYDSTKYYGQSGWFQVGGTSAGAPQWAAVLAVLNANRTSLSTLTALYGASSGLYDITEGGNAGYGAATGYDMVTGLGSPRVGSLVLGP
ncbi:MAG: S53 family peptidase [Armatimonadetes bacterium]|nr:S53 family peptidase [Armatimonadota bacterium]